MVRVVTLGLPAPSSTAHHHIICDAYSAWYSANSILVLISRDPQRSQAPKHVRCVQSPSVSDFSLGFLVVTCVCTLRRLYGSAAVRPHDAREGYGVRSSKRMREKLHVPVFFDCETRRAKPFATTDSNLSAHMTQSHPRRDVDGLKDEVGGSSSVRPVVSPDHHVRR